jgi:hypothetical protein
MLKSIDALNEDGETKVIVLISKPPHKTVLDKIIKKLEEVEKPVVVCLLDAKVDQKMNNVYFVSTLTKAGQKALELISKKTPNLTELDHELKAVIQNEIALKKSIQTKVKGLFCGGTLTAEALSVLRNDLKGITSNVAKKAHEKMEDPMKSFGHNLVDLGDDIFTQGKPHPMIEPMIRLDRILLEAKNPETSVILLDFELGLGSHEDPVGVTMDTILEARKLAEKDGRSITFVAYVCGTDKDSQGLEKSEKQLSNHGIIVAKTNAHAAMISAAIVGGAK